MNLEDRYKKSHRSYVRTAYVFTAIFGSSALIHLLSWSGTLNALFEDRPEALLKVHLGSLFIFGASSLLLAANMAIFHATVAIPVPPTLKTSPARKAG